MQAMLDVFTLPTRGEGVIHFATQLAAPHLACLWVPSVDRDLLLPAATFVTAAASAADMLRTDKPHRSTVLTGQQPIAGYEDTLLCMDDLTRVRRVFGNMFTTCYLTQVAVRLLPKLRGAAQVLSVWDTCALLRQPSERPASRPCLRWTPIRQATAASAAGVSASWLRASQRPVSAGRQTAAGIRRGAVSISTKPCSARYQQGLIHVSTRTPRSLSMAPATAGKGPAGWTPHSWRPACSCRHAAMMQCRQRRCLKPLRYALLPPQLAAGVAPWLPEETQPR